MKSAVIYYRFQEGDVKPHKISYRRALRVLSNITETPEEDLEKLPLGQKLCMPGDRIWKELPSDLN